MQPPNRFRLLFVCLLLISLLSSAFAQNDKVALLSWQDNSNNESHWVVERALQLAGPWTTVVTLQSTTVTEMTPGGALSSLPADSPERVRTGYRDTGLGPNTLYLYRVRASNTAGVSAPTNTASITTDGPPIPPPLARPGAPSLMKAERLPPQ